MKTGIYQTLILLALPIICQNFLAYGVTLSDNLMVGCLGEAAINGLYMAAIIQLVLQMLLGGFEAAMMVLSTQYWGQGNRERIKDIVAICFRTTVFCSAVFTLVSFCFPRELLSFLTTSGPAIEAGAKYLRTVSLSFLFYGASAMLILAMRSVEIVRIGLINSLIAFFLNIFLNYTLIFGHFGLPAFGVEGAALATVLSRSVELGVVMFFVLRLDTRLGFRLRDFLRTDRALSRDLVRYGSPLLLGQVVWAVNKFTMRWIVGHFSPESSAAVSIAENLDGLLCVGTFGLASAMGILTGRMIGARQFDEVRDYARKMQLVFAGIGVLSFAVVLLLRDVFISFYKLTPDTISQAHVFLLVLAFAVLGRSYQAPCLMGLVKAGGDTSFVFKNDTFWVFCWVLPSALIARYVFHAPDWVVYALLLSDQITKCFVAVVKINRFRWMKNLTRESADSPAAER